MHYLLIGCFWLLLVTPAAAFNPTVTEVSRPYEITTLASETNQPQSYLGELEDFPLMYELTSDEPFTLQVQVQQRYQSAGAPTNFSLIAIRQNDRGGGVTEVARLQPTEADWVRQKDARLGIPLWTSPELSAAVEPGVYRIEVSTPDNIGKYLVTFGTGDSNDGYFATLGGILTTQQFFGYSFVRLLTSSYVYYPLGIILLLVALQRTWKYRKLIAHAA